MTIVGLHFIRPWWFIAYLPYLFVIWRLYREQHSTQHWEEICDKHLLPKILIKTPRAKKQISTLLVSIAGFLMIFALTGPAWEHETNQGFHNEAGVIYLVDMSNYLYTTDIKPSRLERLEYKLSDLLNGNKDLNLGMVAFAGEAYTVSPITSDAKTIEAMLPDLKPDIMPIAGHNISMGLELSASLLQQAGTRPQNIVLITASNPDKDAIDTAKKLAANNIHISVYSIGTTIGGPVLLPDQDLNNQMSTSRIDTAKMQSLAEAGHGIYVPFSDTSQDTDQLLSYLENQDTEKAKKTDDTLLLWHDQGPWFILLLVFIACLGFRKNWFEELSR